MRVVNCNRGMEMQKDGDDDLKDRDRRMKIERLRRKRHITGFR